MKLIKNLSQWMLLLGVLFMVSSCNDDEDPVTPPVDNDKTIVTIATETPNLTSLVAALQKVNLVETLNGTTEYTVFAPTDDAFAQFLADNNIATLDDVPDALLTQILLNHVVVGEAKSTDLSTGYINSVATRGDDALSLYINTSAGVNINGVSDVITANVDASNGIVHIVDAVIGLPTVVTFATADDTFSSLVAALTRSDLTTDYVSILTGDGPFTVFAPTNDAFSSLLSGLGFSSLADVPVDVLQTILNYHVVAGANVQSSALVDGNAVETFQGESITIDLTGGAGIIDASGMKANVVAADVQSNNGVVHAIDKVIIPQAVLDIINPTIAGVVSMNPDFSSLLAAVVKADLVETLSGDTEFTVFAPTNAAFAQFLQDKGFASLDEVPADALKTILLNHVVTGTVPSTALSTGYVKTNAAESTTNNLIDMYINLDSGVVINGQSTVTAADVAARNGIIHVVDAVIDLPTVVTFAVADGTFGTLVAALSRSDNESNSGLIPALSGTGPFTVFAPTNDAFGDLLAELGVSSLEDIDLATLEAVLKYHVIAGSNVLASTLTDGMMVATFEGTEITIDLDNGAQIIDNRDRVSDIIVTDVQASNGVVHAINKVILP